MPDTSAAGPARATTALLRADLAQVILVDLQAKLMPAIAGRARVIRRAVFLGATARLLDIPVTVTEHCAARIGGSVAAVAAVPGIQILAKTHFSAAHQPGLLEALPRGRPQVLVAGAETHVCVYQTAVGLLEAGFAVTLVADASGSGRVGDHRLATRDLAHRGARVATTEQAAFEWLGHADHARFRDVLALLKAARAQDLADRAGAPC